MIIEKLKGNIRDMEIGARRIDTIPSDREDLAKTHRKVKTAGGEVFALSLEEGQVPVDGSVIYEDDSRIVCFDLQPEDCLVIKPEGQLQLAVAAFNIGNMHCDAYIDENCIMTPYNYVLEGLLQKLNIPFERKTCKLSGFPAKATHHGSEGHHHHNGEGHHHGE